jgi:hypothetical protein
MNGQDIVTTSNANIELAANGTGKVVVKGNTNQGAIQFNCEANSHGQIVIAAPHSESASNTLTLPSTGGDARLVSTSSTATLTNKTLTAPKIADGGFIADANGNELVVFQTTSSAVNQLEITNNASGSNPILAATGDDTNIGITLTPKGTGEIVIGAGNLNYGGTAVTSTGAELNILDGVTSTTAELNILDGVTSTAAELNIIDGDTSATSTTLADADRVVVNDNGTMVQVALTDFETYFESALDTLSNVTTVGALNSGSITSGFGAIDVGSSNLTATGTISLGATSFNDNNITNVGSIALDSIASDAGTGTAITFSAGNVPNTQTAGSQSGNITPDFSQYTNFILTLTGNIVLQDPGDEVAGQSGIFVFIQDGTGSRTLSHADDRYFVAGGTSITLSTAANAIDIVPYFVQADGKIHLGAAQLAFTEA